MKRGKRLAALLLAALLCAGCAGVQDDPYIEVIDSGTPTQPVVADPVIDSPETAVTLSLGTVAGQQGELITVPLTVSAQAYLVNADLAVKYDPRQLEPVENATALAVAADWPGGLWSDVTASGTLSLMLAREDDGEEAEMTLCLLAFRLLVDPAETEVTLTLTASTVGVCAPDGEETALELSAVELRSTTVQAESGEGEDPERTSSEP